MDPRFVLEMKVRAEDNDCKVELVEGLVEHQPCQTTPSVSHSPI